MVHLEEGKTFPCLFTPSLALGGALTEPSTGARVPPWGYSNRNHKISHQREIPLTSQSGLIHVIAFWRCMHLSTAVVKGDAQKE